MGKGRSETITVGINVFPLRPGKNGGVESLVKDMVAGLLKSQSRYRYVLFTSRENHDLFPKEHTCFKKHLLKIPIASYKNHAQLFKEAITAERPDFVHYPLTTIFPLDLNIPCLLSVMDIQHEHFPEFFSQEEWDLRNTVYRTSVQKARRIIAISNHTKTSLIDKYGRDPEVIDVVHPWCADDFYRTCGKTAGDRARREFALPERYIIYPAGTWPHKNHERLFRALADLRDEGDRIPLVLMGIRDKSEETVLKRIEALHLQDLVYKLGFVERRWIPPLLAGADFLVYPSLFEGFGLPVLEAMALGTPVACAENTSLPEVGGDAVLFFDEKKVPSIREAIRNLWNNPLKRTEFAKRGRKRAQLFHKKIGIKTLLDIYDRMVGMRGFKKGIQ